MSEQKESSVLFSLKELMNLEEDRIKQEEETKRAQAEAAERSRLDAERRAREEEEARIRAEENRRRTEEARSREENARLEALRLAEVEKARVEAEQRARMEAMAVPLDDGVRLGGVEHHKPTPREGDSMSGVREMQVKTFVLAQKEIAKGHAAILAAIMVVPRTAAGH